MDVMMNMTTEDVRRLRGQFTESLDLEAFVRLMRRSLRDRIQSELAFVVGVIELFDAIDVNGDAMLDWDEFASYVMDAGQAKADFYFEGSAHMTKHYIPLTMPPPDPKTPLRNITTRIQQMRLLTDQNAVAYFEANSDVMYIYGLQFDSNEGPRHLSTMRLHTAFQEHVIIDAVYIPSTKSLVTSSVLTRGYLSVWSLTDLYNPVMTHRLESLSAQEHLCWVPSLKCIATSAVMFPRLHSDKVPESKRDSYRPNTDQFHTKTSRIELWDLSGKTRAPPPGAIATKEVKVIQERLKGVTAIVTFQSINRTYFAVGREDGILSVVDGENGDEVGSCDAHGSGVKILVYSNKVESAASVGFHSYADETSLHISTWKKTSSGGMLAHDTTLKHHRAPVELLAFVDSNHHFISVDRTETFIIYSSVMRTLVSEPWECLQSFQCSPPPAANWHLPQNLWTMFAVPETATSDAVLIAAGTKVKFFDCCQVRPREEVFFACYCSALNVIVGATSTKVLLWKGDTGMLWKTYEYEAIVLSIQDPTAKALQPSTTQASGRNSREAEAHTITAVCVDDRERKIIIGDDAGSIKVLNASNGNVTKELDPHACCVVAVAYVLYGKRVISISSDSVLHISNEDDPQGFYVPFGGGPVQSVLMQSLRLLPQVKLSESSSISRLSESCYDPSTSTKSSAAKYVILKSTGNEALNLLAVLIGHYQGDNFIQVWNFDISHPQGTCVAPPSSGEITCLSFFGSTADIVGGTSTGRVFFWSPVPGTTSYSCIMELSCSPSPSIAKSDKEQAAITHVDTVCALDTHEKDEKSDAGALSRWSSLSPKERLQISLYRQIIKDRLQLEHECGVYVFASDDGGFVTQWHVRRSVQDVFAIASLQIATPIPRPLSSTGHSRRDMPGTNVAAFQHEQMNISFDSITALYHQAKTNGLHGEAEKVSRSSVMEDLTATQKWQAHGESILSFKISLDPLALVTSSASGQIKFWSVDGKPYGVLDHFATRRAPFSHPWTFPVDMAARRQRQEAKASGLLQSALKSAPKSRVSALQERLSLTKRDLTFSRARPSSRRENNVCPYDVGRALRNVILKQTTSGIDTRRKTCASTLKVVQQDTSPLHSVLRELEQHMDKSIKCLTSLGEKSDSRAKYAMVTLADVKSIVTRPRIRSNSTVHCDLTQSSNQQMPLSRSKPVEKEARTTKQKELYITSVPSSTVNRMELVEYLWQDPKSLDNKSISDQKVRRRAREASDDVLRYHVKMAHTWQPYLKQ